MDQYVRLTISSLGVWNIKLDNFSCQDGKHASESAHGHIFESWISGMWYHMQIFGQTFNNTLQRPNKIFAAKHLVKTTKFSHVGCKNAKFPTLSWKQRISCGLSIIPGQDFLLRS